MNEPDPTRKYDKPPAFEPREETTDQVDPSTVGEDTTGAVAPPSFGDYELIAEIARGGMGVVYKARQRSLNRVVALKMIKSGEFANQEQVDRFYKEAEAAASLDHPGIVPVYEVGEVNGQHYFTMGFVDGESLADRVSKGLLPSEEAARYATAITDGVTYAHSKGVIHRDLKPGNVLITSNGQLRITDFGLAKRIEEDSELTTTGQILGTPSYMPPEQAAGKLSSIGPASDIYSIGATLYCMLTGRPPFQAATIVETLQLVIDSEPVSPRHQNPAVSKDLETICLKCLEKDPRRRFANPQELSDELTRFLGGEPILARPISTATRLWRWCYRRPALASMAFGLMLSIVVALTVTTYLWLQARDLSLKWQAEAYRANKNLGFADDIVEQFLTQVSESEELLAGSPRTHRLRRRLLEQAKDYYQGFVQANQNAALHVDLAAAHYRLGKIARELGDLSEAESSLKRALQILGPGPDVNQSTEEQLRISCFDELSVVYATANRQQESLEMKRQSIAIARSWLAINPNSADTLMSLGNLYRGTADTLLAIGHRSKALENYRESIEILAQLPQNEEQIHAIYSAYSNMANLLATDGKLSEAIKIWEDSSTRLEQFMEDEGESSQIKETLAFSYHSLSLSYGSIGQSDNAQTFLRKAIEIREQLIGDNPGVPRHVIELARSLTNLSMAELRSGDRQAAIDTGERGITLLDRAVLRHPDIADLRYLLASAHVNMGQIYTETEQLEDSLTRAVHLLKKLVQEHPNVAEYKIGLVAGYGNLSLLHVSHDRIDQAAEFGELSLEAQSTLIEQDEAAEQHKATLAQIYVNQATIYGKLGDKTRQLAAFRESIQIYNSLIDKNPRIVAYRVGLGAASVNLAGTMLDQNQFESALELIETAQVQSELILDGSPNHPLGQRIRDVAQKHEIQVYGDRAWFLATAADSDSRAGDQAVKDATKACQLSGYSDYTYLAILAAAHAENGNFSSAVRIQEQAIAGATPSEKEDFEARLELYKSGKPYHK